MVLAISDSDKDIKQALSELRMRFVEISKAVAQMIKAARRPAGRLRRDRARRGHRRAGSADGAVAGRRMIGPDVTKRTKTRRSTPGFTR